MQYESCYSDNQWISRFSTIPAEDATVRQTQWRLTWQPWRADKWEELGEIYHQKDELQKARHAYLWADTVGNLTPFGQLQLAIIHRKLGDIKASDDVFGGLLNLGYLPENIYSEIVKIYREEGRIDLAIKTVVIWEEKYPQSGEAIYIHGLLVLLVSPKEAYLLLGNSMLSQQHAERAGYLRSNIPSEELPSSYQWVLIGRSLATIAEWDLAMHAFKMAVETNPYYAEAWALFGEAREQLHLDGWPMLSMAYELDPGSVVVRALMAGYWYRKGDLEAAEKLFQAISQEETDEGTWLLEIARIAESRKKYKEALKLYQQAVTLEPEDPTFWLELSRFCATNGFQIREVGLQAARQAVLLSPAESNSHALMGWTLFLLGDLESSERILLHSLEIDRTDSKSHLYLGQVYLQAGKFHLARKHLEYAGSLDYGDDATVTMARRLLDQIQ